MKGRECVNDAGALRVTAMIGLLASTLGLAACITVEGQSSGEMKKAMQDSFIFRSADMFYPDGVPDDLDALPELKRKQVKQIQEVLEIFLAGVQKANTEQHEDLSQLFQRDVKENFDAWLVLLNEGQPISQIDPSGEITIDVKIAQAFYRTALIAGLTDSSVGGGNFMSRRFAGDDTTEADIIREFLEIKETVDNTRGQTMIGDVFEGLSDDDMDGSWFTMTDMASDSTAVEEHYFPPMTFLLAHEYGHAVLGHLDAMRGMDDDDCEEFHNMESEADLYAMLVQILHIRKNNPGAFAFPLWSAKIENSLGYQDFFKYTFNLSGFTTEGVAACSHPDPEERRQNLEDLYREIMSG
ncbi:ImmA/IrrE family metallo-endopeptidase [Marinobacterium rhizophilum]|uniref:ImmA/IrrE family metallo-endopeptidase n=1 Tax=Marinobacterium rhizophilum TaxID=420402 RepID=UPI000366495B|nr:hypothetical protein [Marinobacterium rhizophilum]